MKSYKNMDILPEVQEALNAGKPVVALESTIISHGMPYPQNVETASEVEKVIRRTGAVPATIAIIKGQIKIGLTPGQLDYFGQAENVLKASRCDMAYAVSAQKDAATTVAATMICAHLAGIHVFATGGIGGVHRGAQETFDISADLPELAQTPVTVVGAGAKALLDLPLTLEYLETLGVPVVGYQTEHFPAFYTRESGLKANFRLDTEVAKLMKEKKDMNLKGGCFVANPIPEEWAMDKSFIDNAIEKALQEAEKQNIRGKATTPFLLDAIKKITGGSSLKSNIQLVYNNARVAAEIAIAYSELMASES